MALRFVGIDPGTAGGNCPSVWVDEGTGDLILQGWEVTDHVTLAEVSAKSPIPAGERVIRIPARMRAMVKEACGDRKADL